MREATRLVLVLLVIAAAAGCASMPTPRTLVPKDSVSAKQVAALGQASGSIIDVLTVSGEETYLLLRSVTDDALSGEPIDPSSAEPVPDQSVRLPFNQAALIYYAERPAKDKHADSRESGRPLAFPAKDSYPQLPAVGAAEKGLPCMQLEVELSRAEALRWFARNEGLMGYTPAQVLEHHAVTTAEVAAVAFLLLASGGYGGGPNFSGPPAFQKDAARSLRDQVGYEQLRWAITAADLRIAGLLHIKRANGCPERSTLAGDSDLQMLQQFDALKDGSAANKPSGVALLHEQTRLLDTLGPRPLPEGRLADCGLYRCDNSTDQGETSGTVVELTRLLSDLKDERVQHIFAHAVWFGETASVFGRVKLEVTHKELSGSLVVFDRSLVFARTSAADSNPNSGATPPVRIPFSNLESIQVGSLALNRWVVAHTRDGHAYYFAVRGQWGRSQTLAAGRLLQTELQTPGR
jgi:hypothetical protein